MEQFDISRRLAEIEALGPVEPTHSEIAAIQAAAHEPAPETMPLEDYKAEKEYSGKLLLRIPKELHKQLALRAKDNGVSINQYILYKLAK